MGGDRDGETLRPTSETKPLSDEREINSGRDCAKHVVARVKETDLTAR